jgi:LacI family transcriptional regulator
MRHRVALLIETSNAYARGLLRGIYTYAREQGSWATFLPEHSRGELPLDLLSRWRGDGIIARIENPQIAEAVAKLKLPVVDVSATGALPGVPWVETHDESIAQLAIDHFRQRGFRHFAFCGDDRFAWSRYRRDGMQRLLDKSGIKCHTFGAATARSLIEDEQRLAEWVVDLPKPIGILSCYDIRGRQLIEICQRNQIAVPEQVGVLGVDNDELVCNLAEIPLSSVIPNSNGAGYLAAKLLSQMLAGHRVDPTAHLLKRDNHRTHSPSMMMK